MKHHLLALSGLTCLMLAAAAAAAEVGGIVLTSDRTVDATSVEAIVKGVCKDEMTPQQRAFALWKFFIRRNRPALQTHTEYEQFGG